LDAIVVREDMMSVRPPGMHDVARAARVSHQTVSRVLNDHPHVRPATRERVQRAIAELGYRRNAAARSLVTRRSGVIGVLTPRTGLYGPTSSMIAVEVAAREAGYFVSLASVADTSAAALGAAVEHFKDQAAEAVVLIAPEREFLAAARIVSASIPVVTMCADFRVARPSLVSVAMDNRAGARLATSHLLRLGHREIAFVSGPATSPEATARQRSWQDEVRRAGLDAGASSLRACRRRCSPPTTRWPSACCRRSPRPASTYPETCPSPASTTSLTPPTSPRR
jgi:DNA-binding LacI/PurR family transcriptional regulator